MSDSSPVEQDDFDALLELLDRETMREVIGLLMSSAPERLESARVGLAAGDAATAASAFHAMRSACGQLGAKQLEALCAEGERAARAGDVVIAAERLAAAGDEFARCRAWFASQGWIAE